MTRMHLIFFNLNKYKCSGRIFFVDIWVKSVLRVLKKVKSIIKKIETVIKSWENF